MADRTIFLLDDSAEGIGRELKHLRGLAALCRWAWGEDHAPEMFRDGDLDGVSALVEDAVTRLDSKVRQIAEAGRTRQAAD